jgi:hypothetical protein
MQSTSSNAPVGSAVETPREGCLSSIGWFFSGLVLPTASLAFYRRAAKKSVGGAILFFLFFTVCISLLTVASVGTTILALETDIRKAYATGALPVITIDHGIASVDAPQPIILFDDSYKNSSPTLVAIDTTGKLRLIDQTRYDQGFLLTRADLQVYNSTGRYTTIPLKDINDAFQTDPLVVDADSLARAWTVFAWISLVVLALGLFLWHFVVRLMIIATMALVIWGITVLLRPGTGFGPIIITALYAVVPAVYVSHLLTRSEVPTFGVQTGVLLLIWILGLIAALGSPRSSDASRPQLWTAWLGLPMVLLMVGDIFWPIPAPYGLPVLWGVAGITVVAIVVVGRLLSPRGPNSAGSASPSAPLPPPS